MIGHNSADGERLRSFIERIERLDEEIDAIKEDRKDILTEAKSTGFDPKIVRARMGEPWTAEERDHQLLRRGR